MEKDVLKVKYFHYLDNDSTAWVSHESASSEAGISPVASEWGGSYVLNCIQSAAETSRK